MLPTTCRRLLLNGLATALLLGCQPSDPLLDRDGSALPSYPRVGGEPPLQPELNQATLPDFGSISDVASKKAAFFGFLRPLVEHQNQHMQRLREHILQLDKAYKQQGGLHPDDQRWLSETADLFRVDSDQPGEQLQRLRRKVGKIPTAMVLAQAANESAWGTSRFARQGNNLFGMWCFRPGCGLEPLQRSEGATHEVAAYSSVEEGIYRYLINLNANSSYRDLRGIRQCLRREERPLTGRAMAAGLTGYSERGSHYVKELRAMIRINQLEPWAGDWWGNTQPDNPCYPLVQVTIEHPDPIVATDNDDAEEADKPMVAAAAISAATVSATEAVSNALTSGASVAVPGTPREFDASTASPSAATAAPAAATSAVVSSVDSNLNSHSVNQAINPARQAVLPLAE